MPDRIRVHFPLEIVDNWPPVSSETLWAEPLETPGRFRIDTIPFFVRDIAIGDVVHAEPRDDDTLVFSGLVSSGGHRTIRVLVKDIPVDDLVTQLHALGCEAETMRGIVAVDIPNAEVLGSVRARLTELEAEGLIDWEEAWSADQG